jgi:hypothetical protein
VVRMPRRAATRTMSAGSRGRLPPARPAAPAREPPAAHRLVQPRSRASRIAAAEASSSARSSNWLLSSLFSTRRASSNNCLARRRISAMRSSCTSSPTPGPPSRHGLSIDDKGPTLTWTKGGLEVAGAHNVISRPLEAVRRGRTKSLQNPMHMPRQLAAWVVIDCSSGE